MSKLKSSMRILYIDIETAPNIAHVWGLWQQNVSLNQLMSSVYTLSFAAKWHGEKGILFDSVDKSTPLAMTKKVWQLLDEADVVCHYNGTRFDIPMLNKDFLQHGLAPPSGYHQIDLLKIVKQRFKFPSNKLDYVVTKLGIGKKVGHMGHELWTRCLAGDKKAWKIMEKYNKMDTLLLEGLYNKLVPWMSNHPNHALYTDHDRPVCPNCGSEKVHKKGIEHTKTMSYQRFRCGDCESPIRGRSSILTKEKKKAILVGSKL